MPVPEKRPEIGQPRDPDEPEIPQEDPQIVPDEFPPEEQPERSPSAPDAKF